MNLAILDGILHGALKPAFIARLEPKTLAGFIRQAKTIKPLKLNDLSGQQAALLHHFPNLTKQIEEYPASPIEPLPLESEIPQPQTLIDQFYGLLIANETVLRYNGIVLASANWTHPIDQEYQVTKALRDLKVLAQQANEEWNENQQLDSEKELGYPLMVLKLHTISFYFSLQETFKHHLKSTTTLEDFYTLELMESPQNITPLLPVSVLPRKGVQKSSLSATISFGFKGEKEKLTSVIFQLCRHINLLDQDQCSANDLFDLLTRTRIEPGKIKIYLDCETTQFRLVLDCLKNYFNDLSFANLEKAQAFHSKNGKLLLAQNLSASRTDTPKEWEEIRKIINQMQ